MPGLLQKLNKKPRRQREPSSGRIVLPDHTSAADPMQTGQMAPSDGAASLLAEVLATPQGSGITQELARQTDALPWWVETPPQSSPNVDAIIPLARKIIAGEMRKGATDDEQLQKLIRRAVTAAVEQLPPEQTLTHKESEAAARELWNFLRGKGPLDPLFQDPLVTDIFITAHDTVKCKRRGHLLDTPFNFRSAAEYGEFIATLLHDGGTELSAAHPIVRCSIRDTWHTWVEAIHPSILDSTQPSAMLRVPRLQQGSFYDLIRTKTLPAALAAWLSELVATGACSILVTGPNGTGKTTLASALLSAASSEARIITIEEVAELFPTAHQVEKLLYRSASATAVDTEALIEAALRRAPEWLAFGDLPRGHSRSMLRAFESDVATLATITAPSAESALQLIVDALRRENGAFSAEECLPRMHRAIDIVITMGSSDGRPYIESIAEQSGANESRAYTEIVRFRGAENGKRRWEIRNLESRWVKQLADQGHYLRPGAGLLAAGQ